jgi:hypothetical protein
MFKCNKNNQNVWKVIIIYQNVSNINKVSKNIKNN